MTTQLILHMKGIRRHALLLTILICSVLRVYGYEFHSVNLELGLSVRETASVIEDPTGFVWASSKTGAIRLNGSEYRQYSFPFASSDVQNVKLVCQDGIFMAYSNNGEFFRYNKVSDTFDAWFDMGSLLDQYYFSVVSAVLGPDGSVWASTSSGVCRYSDQEGCVVMIPKAFEHMDGAICLMDRETMLVCSVEGLAKVDLNTCEITRLIGADFRFTSEVMFYDGQTGQLWIGSHTSGLLVIDLKRSNPEVAVVPGIPSEPVLAMESTVDGQIVVGVNGSGLFFIDKSTYQVVSREVSDIDNKNTIISNSVYDVLVTSDKMWVATQHGGLCYSSLAPSLVISQRHVQNDPNSLCDDYVNDVMQDNAGNLWHATEGGVSVFKTATGEWLHLYQGEPCTCLAQDSNGDIWIGTFGMGYHVVDQDGRHIRSGSDCRYIKALYCDSFGDMWIGGVQTVLCRLSNGYFRRYKDMSVYAIAEYGRGTMLLACAHALVRLDKLTGSQSVIADGLMLDVATSGSLVWAAASGKGVLKYNMESQDFQFVTRKNGLPSDWVNTVYVGDRDLWVGTENGLCRYDLNSGGVECFWGVPEISGLAYNNGAVSRLRNGFLHFGTGQGAVMFSPSGLYSDEQSASIYMQEVRFGGISVRERDEWNRGLSPNEISNVTISYRDNGIAVMWTPVGADRKSIRLQWRLSGKNAQWTDATGSAITVSRFPFRGNVFELRMVDLATERVLDERSIDIYVKPPFWRTWWFILLSTAVFAYLLFISLGYYTAKLKQRVVPILSIDRAVQNEAQSKPSAVPSKKEDPFVTKAITVVFDNLSNSDFDKDAFARQMGVSPSLLYKKLKDMSGQSPTDFIRTIRMGQALKLLQSGAHTVTEVSEMCGFSSASYFSTAFKNFYGISPASVS